MLSPSTFLTAYFSPDTCREPGNAICFLAEFGLTVGDPCCEGSTCQTYPYGGTKDSFCLYDEGIKEGESCAVGKQETGAISGILFQDRTGVCEGSLTCTEDICTGLIREEGNSKYY